MNVTSGNMAGMLIETTPHSQHIHSHQNLPATLISEANRRAPNYATHQHQRSMLSQLSSLFDIQDGVEPNFEGIQNELRYRNIKFKEIMNDYASKWLAMWGLIASFFCALQMPLFGFVLSKYIFLLMMDDIDQFVDARNFWTLVFALLCMGIGISSYFQKLCFALGGENMSYAIRVKLFRSLMHKSVGWYDCKTKSPGVLTNVLTEDITALNGLTTESVAIGVEAALGLFFSCLICFVFSWRVGLVVTLTCPFMVLGGLGMSKLQFNQK